MSRFGTYGGVRCDGCGIISSDVDGYYTRYHADGSISDQGNITSQGRECDHDFCERCESEHAPEYACRKCGLRLGEDRRERVVAKRGDGKGGGR